MKVVDKMTDSIRRGIRSFLQIEPAQQNVIMIMEQLDFNANAAKNVSGTVEMQMNSASCIRIFPVRETGHVSGRWFRRLAWR